MPIHTQNFGFGGFEPLNEELYQQNPQRHILALKDVI